MNNNFWVKTYISDLDDPDLAMLPDRLYRRVTELTLLAGRLDARANESEDDRGILPDTDKIAFALRRDKVELEADLQALDSAGFVSRYGDGWQLNNYAERQAPISAAERNKAKRHRDREPVTVTELPKRVTQPVTNRNADTDKIQIRLDTEEDIENSNNNGNGKNPLYADADEYDSLPDAVKQSLRSKDTDWQYMVKRFKAVRMDLTINPAKEDDMWRLYKSLTPPTGETVKQWVDYVAGRVADKPTAPGWKFVETIFTAIQASGSLAKNIAEFESKYKTNGKNGNGAVGQPVIANPDGSFYL